MPYTVRAERPLIRAAGGSIRHLLVDLTAPDAPSRRDRAPLNVALVLDRSGSMSGEKIVLARRAVEYALRLLTARDRFSLVVFDDQVDVIVPSTAASAEATGAAVRRLAEIEARGSTALADGWAAGAAQVGAHLDADTIGRCVLVTDGQANHGEQDPEALGRIGADLRTRGVATSTFGIGADFDERTLQRIAEGGQGHFYYVESPQAIPDLLASELGDSLEVVARDAALVVRVPDVVDVATVGALPVATAGAIVRFELGDLVSRQERQIILRLTFGAGVADATRTIGIALSAKDDALGSASTDVSWTFADHAANDAQPRDRVVDRAVAGAYAALARQQALELNRAGQFDAARAVLEAVARKIASYAGTDKELRHIVDTLRSEFVDYGAAMSPVMAKQRHFAAYATLASREPDGKAQKRRR